MCIASQLQHRYSVPVTEPLEHEEALKFANLLEKAYKEQIDAVPINPFLKEEFHHKKWGEGKKLLKDYFPFTLRQVKAGCKEPELPAGHAPPVVICPRSLVVSVTTEKFSKDIEKIIESRASNLKALEKNPTDGFRLNVCKNNSKRQGASVSNCILNLIQFLRQVLVGQPQAQDKLHSQTPGIQSPGAQAFDDAASQRSSVTGQSERNQVQERLIQRQATEYRQQQELRQEEIKTIINSALQILKTKPWREVQLEDKQIILGLFTVIGGWYGYTRIAAGSQVQAQVNGCWNEATVIDEGVGKRRVSVILNEDATLALVKVPHAKIKPQQTTMDKGINDRLNFDDLCEAVTFLHQQQDHPAREEEAGGQKLARASKARFVSLDQAMLSEKVLFQMILKVCSQLNWNKIDHNSESFNQFRKILIQVTSASSPVDGQSHEDKSEDYLEKQLIESWERIIDRDEIKNLEFYTPREAARSEESLSHLDTTGNKVPAHPTEPKAPAVGNEGLLDILGNASSPYVDTDYAQPVSSYLHGLPEPTAKKNQKEAALKLLFYWEKQVLPTTREFVRSTFQKWEMNYYFEQIRHHLRQGDQRAAIADAMVLWEHKIPNGVNLPSENIDWTAKVADECLVDSWALAKISFSKSASTSGGQSSSKSAHSLSPETSLPLILRLQNLGVLAIVIQIKLVDARYNVVLGEFYDGENSCSHFIWFPISHLYELDYPLPPRPAGYLRKSLTQNYLQSISNINSLYARKTLIQFFSSRQSKTSEPLSVQVAKREAAVDGPSQGFKKGQFGELKLHELISWSVQAEFSANPFNGWLRDLNCAIPIQKGGIPGSSSKAEEAPEKGSLPEQESIQSLIEETSDRIIIERLLQREGKRQAENQAQEGSGQIASSQNPQGGQGGEAAAGNPLGQIKDLLRNAVTMLNKYKEGDKNKEITQSDAYQTLSELADWTASNWHLMSEHVGTSRAVCDLCQQGKGDGGGQLSTDNQLIALHSVISQSRAAGAGAGYLQSIATLLMFPKAGCNLTPCSKIQFYSDPNQVNLVGEITAGAEARTTLPPLLLNHGQIWAKVLPGSLALLGREQQLEARSSLPCALFQIPRQWGVVCWLTETLSTCFLEGEQSSIGLAKEVYCKLIGALDAFYQNSASPQMFKSQVLRLLTRLVRKLRYILRQESKSGPEEAQSKQKVTKEAHLEKTYVSEAFIKVILDDMDTAKRAEDGAAPPSEPGETQLLCSAFLQDSVEFLMTLIVPLDPHAELDSWQDLLTFQQSHLSGLRTWLDPLMKTSLFMHFFNDEIKSLPCDLLREIHNQTSFSGHRGMDHLLLIDRVPIDDALYPKAWLVDQIISMCKKHHARILDPLRDIYFEQDEYVEDPQALPEAAGAEGNKETTKKSCYKIAVILDGWDHLRPLPDYTEYFEQQGRAFEGFEQVVSEDYRQFISLEDSDTEEEEDPSVAAAKEAAKKEEEERRKKEEAEMTPTEWACAACTFVNPIGNGVCEICGGGRRPPMAELVAAFRKQKEEEAAALNPDAKDDKKEEQKDEDAGKGKLDHENLLRLKFLAHDLSKIIKIEQKRVLEQERAARLELLRLEKLKEREKKVEELVLKHCFLKKGFKVWHIAAKSQQPAEEGGSAGEEKKAETKPEEKEKKPDDEKKPEGEKKPEEEKKHQDSDAEKSDDEDGDEKEWQDQESGHNTSSESEQKDIVQAEANSNDAVAESEADGADPRLKKLAELGYDLSLLEAEPQLAAAILASAGEQEQRLAEEQRAQKEAEEAEKKREEEEKARLQKEKEQEELKKKGLATEKVVYHSLSVLFGAQDILEDSSAVRAMFKFLQLRLQDPESGEPSSGCSRILKSIHQTIKAAKQEDIVMPEQPYADQLAEYGLSREQMQTMDAEEFEQTCSVLIAADVVLLFRFFASQGYDFWLQKQAHPSFRVPNKGHKFNAILFEKLKSFVEVSFCQEKKVVQQLEPYQLRLLSKLEGLCQEDTKAEKTEVVKSSIAEPEAQKDESGVVDAKDAKETQIQRAKLRHDPKAPVGFFDDSGIAMNAAAQGPLHWLNQVTQADLSYNWALIKTFSKYFATTVPFINCSTSIADTPGAGAIPIALSAYTSSLRNMCLSNTKSELKHLILKNTSVEREKVPVLRFERLRLHDNDNVGESQARDRRGAAADEQAQQANGRPGAAPTDQARQQAEANQPSNFLFTQAYDQVKDIDPGALRPPQPRGADPHLSFEVYFAGEDVAGMGGPYRQFFSDISQELQMVAQKSGEEDGEDREEAHADGPDGGAQGAKPSSLGLLCPTGNMLAKAERGKDNFALNPGKVSSRDLSLFIFLGVLMGVCVRTNTNLAVNLPTFVWKLLVGQRLATDDITEFDEGIITELSALLRATKEDFELQFEDRFFTTRLSDQCEVPLGEGGATKPLTYDNRVEYIRKVLYTRMTECEAQVEAIRRGMCQVIPAALLNMVGHSELAEWVYGKRTIDIDLLRRHADSSAFSATDELITWFWEVLEEMSQEDRRKFIQFCYAQATIPANDAEFVRQQVRFLIKPSAAQRDESAELRDKRLPKADTCFFNFMLPRYSTKQAMKEKILFAITFDNVGLNAEQEAGGGPGRLDEAASHRSGPGDESY